MMAATQVAGILGALQAMRDRPDSTPLLSRLEGIPTLVIVGEEDQFAPPETAKAMAQSIPGARLAVIPGAGHLTPLERPQQLTDLLGEFVRGLPKKRSGT
jgi:pimeloyl-ACP methyl ester carboxylesterase